MILKSVNETSTAADLKAEREGHGAGDSGPRKRVVRASSQYGTAARFTSGERRRRIECGGAAAESRAHHLNIGHNSGRAPIDARRLPPTLAIYRTPSHARSVAELAITAVPLVTLWTAAWFAFWLGYAWATPFIAVPAAGFLLRLFMIQHDCGHGAFFSRRLANDWVGRVIGVLTLTPYDFWRRTHAIHHASAGNLDRRGIGDLDTLTVREYGALSRWGRLKYRLYRHPLVMFGIGPAYMFLLQHRLPVGLMRNGWQPWASTMATNLAITLVVAVLVWLIGIKAFLLVHLPIILLAAAAGVWLFYVQHQFEHTAWQRNGAWNLHEGRCTVAHIMTCRRCCAGSPRILGYTTCITFAAAFLITDCRQC
jgi:omega-6 fatty acid desaturase (delta-12 desaturase)